MTIRVEREALLRVISRAPLSSNAQQQQQQQQGLLIQQKQQSQDDEFVIVELPEDKLKCGSFFCYDDCIPTDNEDDDDQASVCSLSTGSYSSTSSTSTVDRRVSFAPTLITHVWTREKTLPEDVPSLFYSSQETQTFRQEYRLERKVLNELSIDPDTFPVDDEELSNLVAASNTSPSSSSSISSRSKSTATTTLGGPSRHLISRVVVLHNDKLETFFNDPVSSSELLEDAVESTSLLMTSDSTNDSCGSSSCSTSLSSPSSTDGADFFFDNDSFWSGSLTWY